MKAKKHPITAITLVCALLLNHIAFADDPTQENVDQIIVTGARRPLSPAAKSNSAKLAMYPTCCDRSPAFL